MKASAEEELDRLIEAMNEEKSPPLGGDPDLAEMAAVVRAVRSLRPQAEQRHVPGRPGLRRFLTRLGIGLAAACLAAALIAVPWPGSPRADVVQAMERVVSKLTSYHGALEMRTTNAGGQTVFTRRVELWSDGRKQAFRLDDGTLTVNNGDVHWQARPEDRLVVLLPLVGPGADGSFDLKDEAGRALEYPHKSVGVETVAGREASHIVIEPPGGQAYDLWIDVQTKLPLRLRTAMQNAIQTTYTFVSFETGEIADPSVFVYDRTALEKQGYQVVDGDPGRVVATPREAAAVAGFNPLLPAEGPERIVAFKDRIVLDYGQTTITESKAAGAFDLVANSATGKAAGGPLEVWFDRLRWRQDGLEIAVKGPRRAELAAQVTADLALPDVGADPAEQAEVKVPVDLMMVKAQQQQVDGGHSPWWLDPMQVAAAFVDQTAPAGSGGPGPRTFRVNSNNGLVAVVEVGEGSVERVYLKRLVRQDETGIWSVVGYDKR